MNQLKSIFNSPFKDSRSHPIHTYFPTIASNDCSIRAVTFAMMLENGSQIHSQASIEFFTVCTKLAEMAILYSKDVTTSKKSYLQWGSI